MLDREYFITIFLKDDKTHSNCTFTVTDEDCPNPCQTIRNTCLFKHQTSKVQETDFL